jgi:type III pantothenate kinase
MIIDAVADVGNSRIKWGRCEAGRLEDIVSLPPDDVPAWAKQLEAWGREQPRIWMVAGVHPPRRSELAEWLRGRGQTVYLLERAAPLPLQVRLEHPDRVGIDRLLNAVAANTRRRPNHPGIVIDAGSAVTVDYLDAAGAFHGGAIFPGLRLMARALNDHTALLPLVEVREPGPLPATSTTAAIQAGVFWAVVGGIEALVRQLRALVAKEADIFLTGGDAGLLAPRLQEPVTVWPEMTLEGIRQSAEAWPHEAGGNHLSPP